MSLNERKKGIQIHRAIVYGSHARLLTAAEKALAPDGRESLEWDILASLDEFPPDTHRWTVFLASAATPPPTDKKIKGKGRARYEGEGLAEEDVDFITGGADDLSWLIKRVTFRLHETYPQPNRAIDKPPFAVTETGWGEFPLNIRVQFAPETGEKSVNFVHQLRLHHWGPAAQPPTNLPATIPVPMQGTAEIGPGSNALSDTQDSTPNPEARAEQLDRNAKEGETRTDGDVIMTAGDDEQDAEGEADSAIGGPVGESRSTPRNATPMEGIAGDPSITANPTSGNPVPEIYVNPLPVQAWQYDELVFSDPTATFYDLLISHPETPLPEKSLRQPAEEGAGARWGMDKGSAGVPLEFTQEMARGEGEKLERARRLVIDEMDKWRLKLIELEKEQQRLRDEIAG